MQDRPPSPEAHAAAAARSPRVWAACIAVRSEAERLGACREADGKKIGATRRPPNGRWRGAQIPCGEAQKRRAASGKYANAVNDAAALHEDPIRGARFDEAPVRGAGPAFPGAFEFSLGRKPPARGLDVSGGTRLSGAGFGEAFRVVRSRRPS